MRLHHKRLGLIAGIYIYIFILLDNHFFYVLEEPEFLSQIFYWNNSYIIAGGISLILIAYYGIRYHKLLRSYTKWMVRYFIILGIVLFGLIVYTNVHYPLQEMINTIQTASHLFGVFMSVPVMVLFIRQRGTGKFMKFLNVIAAIWYILLIVQRYMLLTTGSYLFSFSNYASEEINCGRFGAMRILLPIWGNLMIIYNFVKIYARILEKKSCIFYIIQFILGMYCMIFISQTRGYMIAVLSSILVIILLRKKPASLKVKEIVLLSFLVIAAIFSDAIPKFVSSFDSHGNINGSTSIRLYEINYYLECFFNNPIFGNGFAGYGTYSYMEHGGRGVAWYNDVGIIGLMAKTGICAIVIYIVPLIHMLKRAKQIYRKSADKETVFFSVGIVFYLLTSSATLIITDQQRAAAFPVIIAYLEYHYIQGTDGQKIRTELNKILKA